MVVNQNNGNLVSGFKTNKPRYLEAKRELSKKGDLVASGSPNPQSSQQGAPISSRVAYNISLRPKMNSSDENIIPKPTLSLTDRLNALNDEFELDRFLKDRENVSSKDIIYNKTLEQKRQIRHENNGQGYETQITPAMYGKNYKADFAITKQDVKNIRAGKIDEAILNKLENDLKRTQNDPEYYGIYEKLKPFTEDSEHIIKNGKLIDKQTGKVIFSNGNANLAGGFFGGSDTLLNQRDLDGDGKSDFKDLLLGVGIGASGVKALQKRYPALFKTQSGGVKAGMFISNDSSPLNKALDDIIKGKNTQHRYIPMGTTPKIFQDVGMPNARVTINTKVIQKVMGGKHNVTKEQLKNLPQELNNPIAIAKASANSSNPNGNVVLTSMLENVKNENLPIITALHVKNTKDGLEVVNIASVYGKNLRGLQKILHNTLYVNKEKWAIFNKAFGLQLPSKVAHVKNNPSDEIIANQNLNNSFRVNSSPTEGGAIYGSMSGMGVDYNGDGKNNLTDIAIGAGVGASGAKLATSNIKMIGSVKDATSDFISKKILDTDTADRIFGHRIYQDAFHN